MMVTAVRITSLTKYWTTSLWMKKNTGLDSRARQTPIIVSTEQIKVPNKNLITSACVELALTEMKAFFFHRSPLSSHRPRIFMVMTMPELCKWMSRAVQAKSENAEKQSKKDKNVASSAAFFPSSGIHWGLAVHFIFFFLLEPFPARLGITRPSITCPSELWMGKPQTGLQSCPSAQGNYTPTVSSLNTV